MILREARDAAAVLVRHHEILLVAGHGDREDQSNAVLRIAKRRRGRGEGRRRNGFAVHVDALRALLAASADPGELARRAEHGVRRQLGRRHLLQVGAVRVPFVNRAAQVLGDGDGHAMTGLVESHAVDARREIQDERLRRSRVPDDREGRVLVRERIEERARRSPGRSDGRVALGAPWFQVVPIGVHREHSTSFPPRSRVRHVTREATFAPRQRAEQSVGDSMRRDAHIRGSHRELLLEHRIFFRRSRNTRARRRQSWPFAVSFRAATLMITSAPTFCHAGTFHRIFEAVEPSWRLAIGHDVEEP